MFLSLPALLLCIENLLTSLIVPDPYEEMPRGGSVPIFRLSQCTASVRMRRKTEFDAR